MNVKIILRNDILNHILHKNVKADVIKTFPVIFILFNFTTVLLGFTPASVWIIFDSLVSLASFYFILFYFFPSASHEILKLSF